MNRIISGIIKGVAVSVAALIITLVLIGVDVDDVSAAVPSNISVSVGSRSLDISGGSAVMTLSVNVTSDVPVNSITTNFYHSQYGTRVSGTTSNLTGNGGSYTVNVVIPSDSYIGTYKLGTVYVTNASGSTVFYDISAIPGGSVPTSTNVQSASFSSSYVVVSNSAVDATPPTLTSVTLDTHSATNTERAYIDVCLAVEDNYNITTIQSRSGVASVDFAFENSNGSWARSSTGVTIGPDGNYHGRIYLDDVTDPGVYVLHYVTLKDNSGNTAIYNKTGGNLTTAEGLRGYFRPDLDYYSFRIYGNVATVNKPTTSSNATQTSESALNESNSESSPKTGLLNVAYIPLILLFVVISGAVLAIYVYAKKRLD